MKIFNSLTRKKEEFKPIKEGQVSMYVCGPTVYDIAHIGHARAAIAFDLVRRYFMHFKKYNINFVSNITDVEDKIIKRAAEQGISEKELTEKIIPEYQKDFCALRVLPPDHEPRATEYIPQMVELVESLIKKGVAYEIPGDGVYFRVSSFKNYGKLSGKKLDELQAGARIEVDKNKEHPGDFVLWKGAKKGEPTWKGPKRADGTFIEGRPGWHIECSAMSKALLGETFDIHGGGIDLIFPHHEDEIAQSEMASGKPFARVWMHNGHVQINKEKMSKSMGNFLTVQEILTKYNPLVVRYFLISTHYRMPIEFSSELLDQARASLSRLKDCYVTIERFAAVNDRDSNTFDMRSFVNQARRDFESAMDNDFEISRALAAVFDFVAEVNRRIQANDLGSAEAQLAKVFFDSIDLVLGIFRNQEFQVISSEIEDLITQRNVARTNKDFKHSDEIRDKLKKEFGVEIKDTPSGTIWQKIL